MDVKRVFDIVVSLLVMVMLAPFYPVLVLLIKLDSPGPALYRSWRIGKDGKPFVMYKFRTMIAGADQMGSSITYKGDPRITRLGRFLRHTKLDEIPNLLNVLKGEMSIVGPRPESPEWVKLYTPEQQEVLKVRPGMTSLAQIKYRNEEELLDGGSIREQYVQIMQEKLRLDLEYVRNYSFVLDLRILAKAVWALLR